MPFLGLVAAIVFLWGRGFSWVELGLLLGMYAVTIMGITVGFHRLFTHRAFETNRVVQFILAVLGSMAVEGPLLRWVAMHRRHHQHSDRAGDPHSPHDQGRGILGMLRGLWHAHLGWMFQPDPANLPHYVKDLRQSRLLRDDERAVPRVGGRRLADSGRPGRAADGDLDGCVVRPGVGRPGTGFPGPSRDLERQFGLSPVGPAPFRSDDQSRNNFVFGVLALGEGWHNNHHAFPTSARHGLRWWQIDMNYWVICALAHLGLAWKVSLPASRAAKQPSPVQAGVLKTS